MFNKAQGGTDMATTILRLPDVKARTGLSRSTIYLYMNEGTFPESVSLGVRAIGWLESEIDKWVTERIEASRKAQVGAP
jgi:prophage regulatory protein